MGYLRDEALKGERTGFLDGRRFTNAPERRFTACLCFFLAAMTLVTTTRHLGALWMGIEGTTLASAPLIYFHRHQQSLEATWKYLIICSVGIAVIVVFSVLLNYLALTTFDNLLEQFFKLTGGKELVVEIVGTAVGQFVDFAQSLFAHECHVDGDIQSHQ